MAEMIIKKIEISSFGKLKDFELCLDDKINMITADNEWGKSTVCAFILFVLYGIGKGKDKKSAEKYMPWSGEIASGSLVMQIDGIAYRLSRSANARTEKFAAFIDATGETVSTDSRFFENLSGIGRESFCRTVYVSEWGSEVTASGELEAKIRNLVSSGDESVSFASAKKYLEEKKKNYVHKNRSGGFIDKLEELIRGKKSALYDARVKYEIQLEEKSKLQELEKDEEKLSSKVKELYTELSETESGINNDERILGKATAMRIAEEKSEYETFKSNPPVKKKNYTLLILAAVFLLLCAGLFFVNIYIGIACGAVAIIVGTLFLAAELKQTAVRKKYDNTLCEMLDKIEKSEKEFIERFGKDSENFFADNESEGAARAELAAQIAKVSGAKEEIEDRIKALLIKTAQDMILPAEIEGEIDFLQAELFDAKEQNEIIDIATDLLQKSFSELQEKLAPAINQKAGEYLSEFTDGAYGSLSVDHEFNIKIKSAGEIRGTENFSKGTQDAVYLALRLALSDILYEGFYPPLIFDDSFSGIDDKRLSKIIFALENGEKNRQIILFSCSGREEKAKVGC